MCSSHHKENKELIKWIFNNASIRALFLGPATYDDCDLGCLKRLQSRLSSILNLKRGVLQLRAIKDGCVLLVFEIPDFISEAIFPLSAEHGSALQELGVTRLDCGDHYFEFTEKVHVTHRMSNINAL